MHARLVAAIAISVVAASVAQAQAQNELRRPATIRGIPVPLATPTPVATPFPIGPTHIASGTIARITGSILLLELRNRRPLRVDATYAIARGSYSAPLFIGKIVIVEGRFGRDGTLFATTVTRMSKLDATTPLDR
jgi:hypothetical protein